MDLCGAPSPLLRGYRCPRDAGHAGVHHFWTQKLTPEGWRVDVFDGHGEQLVKAHFSAEATSEDLCRVLRVRDAALAAGGVADFDGLASIEG